MPHSFHRDFIAKLWRSSAPGGVRFNNNAGFPGNVIPTVRIDPNMQKLPGIFPLPNATGKNTSGAYNLQIQDTIEKPVRGELLRVDDNISSKAHFFFRGTNTANHNKGPASTVNKFTWMPGGNVDYSTTGPNQFGQVTSARDPRILQLALRVGF